MSPLPERKKTPEELAALRESLGITREGPPPGAPGNVAGSSDEIPEEVAGPGPLPPESGPSTVDARSEAGGLKEDPVVGEGLEGPDSLEPGEPGAERKPKPVRSLRKSGTLAVDKPKKAVSRNSGALPARRHTDQELARLRHQPPAGVAPPPAVQLQQLGAAWPVLAGIYGIGGLLMLVAGVGVLAERWARIDLPFDWLRDAVVRDDYRTILFGIMAGGVAVMLLGALWIYFRKPRSQHHAALLTIIAVLVLVFGTLYFFPGLHGA